MRALLCVHGIVCRACGACVRCATLCFALLRVASRRLPRYSHTSLVGERRRLRVRLRGVRERRKSASGAAKNNKNSEATRQDGKLLAANV